MTSVVCLLGRPSLTEFDTPDLGATDKIPDPALLAAMLCEASMNDLAGKCDANLPRFGFQLANQYRYCITGIVVYTASTDME